MEGFKIVYWRGTNLPWSWWEKLIIRFLYKFSRGYRACEEARRIQSREEFEFRWAAQSEQLDYDKRTEWWNAEKTD